MQFDGNSERIWEAYATQFGGDLTVSKRFENNPKREQFNSSLMAIRMQQGGRGQVLLQM